MLTYNEIFLRLNYNPINGIFIWKEKVVKDQYDKTWNAKHAGKQTGYIRNNGYRIINLEGKEYQCSRLAWLLVNKKWPNGEIDHKNGSKADDRIENLRQATRSQNASNRSTQSNNTSGFKGVWKRKGLNSWVASIYKDGVKINLGSYKTPEEASAAYKKAAIKIHREFVRNE